MDGLTRPTEGRRILYAPRMPADPFARSVFIRSLYSRSLPSKRHANAHTLGGGDQGTQRRGPRGPGGGARADARCARARADARAARALGPFGPLGPFGAEGDRLYATKALPNGIDNTRRTLFRMESIQAEENVRKNPNIYRVRMT